ncbi:b1.2 [Ichnoviriform fugitivi]|uniref:B1.2 n=1 Tax=Ichnoviriform fugitivi TaxID=265522 RepID=Q5BMB0_9VIRU|nr:b1.2 [Ichnoviriform fugitivi]AAX24122.1 b1.2 [Ichnoviriform fugitivi]
MVANPLSHSNEAVTIMLKASNHLSGVVKNYTKLFNKLLCHCKTQANHLHRYPLKRHTSTVELTNECAVLIYNRIVVVGYNNNAYLFIYVCLFVSIVIVHFEQSGNQQITY